MAFVIHRRWNWNNIVPTYSSNCFKATQTKEICLTLSYPARRITFLSWIETSINIYCGMYTHVRTPAITWHGNPKCRETLLCIDHIPFFFLYHSTISVCLASHLSKGNNQSVLFYLKHAVACIQAAVSLSFNVQSITAKTFSLIV